MPGEIVPIMISSCHFQQSSSNNFTIIPALWGLIPRWHRGNFREHGFNTINFGVKNLDTSRMYKPAFNRGQRCVLLCEGYYEHQRVPYRLPPNERSIYYVHSKQAASVKIDDKSTWNCTAINLVYIAGIFDIWTDDEGSEIYNFTILSMASQENSLSWLHPRIPVILENRSQILKWLDFDILGDEAIKIIKHPKTIEWYEVSDYILNPQNKDSHCNDPIDDDD